MTHTLPVTTLSSLEGRPVARDLGIVYGLAVESPNYVREMERVFTGQAASDFDHPLYWRGLYEAALKEVRKRARDLGAEAVLNLRMGISNGPDGSVCTAYGTAATLGPVPG